MEEPSSKEPSTVNKWRRGRGRGRPRKRGRPKKLKRHIKPTGKGRGRPKKLANKGEHEPLASPAPKRHHTLEVDNRVMRGRPLKRDDDYYRNLFVERYEDMNRRPVGRPSTKNGLKLNIVRTGRGQGRPKNTNKHITDNADSSNKAPRKRGRPRGQSKLSTDTTTAISEGENVQEIKGKLPEATPPAKRPRGRPKKQQSSDSSKCPSEHTKISQMDNENDAEVSSEGEMELLERMPTRPVSDEENKNPSQKKRGRPKKLPPRNPHGRPRKNLPKKPYVPKGRPRGRPAKTKKTEYVPMTNPPESSQSISESPIEFKPVMWPSYTCRALPEEMC